MQTPDGTENNQNSGPCPCCHCDPCDCDGVNDEFRGMDQDTGEQGGEDHGLDGQGNRCQSKPINQVETGRHPQDRIFSEGLYCTCNYSGQAHQWGPE